MDFRVFDYNLPLEIIKQDENMISIRLKGVPIQYANALRRICLNGVPIFAIDTVDILENTSIMPDEALAHRLGLIPLKTDSVVAMSEEEIKESSSRVMLTLDSEESSDKENDSESRTVFSNELKSQDEQIRPTAIPAISAFCINA